MVGGGGGVASGGARWRVALHVSAAQKSTKAGLWHGPLRDRLLTDNKPPWERDRVSVHRGEGEGSSLWINLPFSFAKGL